MSGSIFEQLKMLPTLHEVLVLSSIFREPREYEANHNNL
jgi:hypothetical protein